ncbi:hypothetical protein [Streptomyces radicis]|uniref:hypothetical protein n=1 Tax=Streptomyces radicis TaxID=1750517 RepID=UPI0011C437CD|nr:hypothetical protein [Streptomyces radicis]
MLDTALSTRDAVDEALGLLNAYGLITLTDTTVTVHRLLQAVVRATTSAPPRRSRWSRLWRRGASPGPEAMAFALLLRSVEAHQPGEHTTWPNAPRPSPSRSADRTTPTPPHAGTASPRYGNTPSGNDLPRRGRVPFPRGYRGGQTGEGEGRGMARGVVVDDETGQQLGVDGVAELLGTLRPVDCQTCGEGFGRWERPALFVQVAEDVDGGDASLHHRRCRAPSWAEVGPGDRPTLPGFPHATWRATLSVLPTGNTPVMVVNPSCEVAILRRKNGRWRVATLERYAAYGLGTDLMDGVFVVPSLALVVADDRISVRITHEGSVAHSWSVPAPTPEIRKVLDVREWLTIAVTTSADPRALGRANPLPSLIAAGAVRLGAARVLYTEEAQLPRASDFEKRTRAEMIALTAEFARRSLDVQADDTTLLAAIQCAHGETDLLRALDDPAKRLASLLVVQLYATGARSSAGRPNPGGGVHVMCADAAGADAYRADAVTLARLTQGTVARLVPEPTREQLAEAYLADTVIGTPEEFRAAYAFYRDDAGDWGLHQSRGKLALVRGTDARDRAGDLIHRYPRVVVV